MLGQLLALGSGLWMIAAILLLIIAAVVIPLWALIDVSRDPDQENSRTVWIVMMFVCWGFTAFIYSLFGTRSAALRRSCLGLILFLVVGGVMMMGAYRLNAPGHKAAQGVSSKLNRYTDSQCGLKGLSESFEAHGIGVSQGSEPVEIRLSDTYETPRREQVIVGMTQSPVVLVLLSSQPVVWHLSLTQGAQLVGVLVSSTNASGIEGLPKDVPYRVLTRDDGPNGCKTIDGHSRGNLSSINRSLEKLLGTSLTDFNDQKSGPAFVIGDASKPVREISAIPISSFIRRPVLPQGSARALASGMRLSCQVGPWNAPATSCSGSVVASGNMENSDSASDAAAACGSAAVIGGCCMFHLYGKGQWYLTDGVPQSGGRQCTSAGSDCNAGGPCRIGS